MELASRMAFSSFTLSGFLSPSSPSSPSLPLTTVAMHSRPSSMRPLTWKNSQWKEMVSLEFLKSKGYHFHLLPQAQGVEMFIPLLVPTVSASDARKIFRQSRQKGAAVVHVAVQEVAEFYSVMLNIFGFLSVIEPEDDLFIETDSDIITD